MGVTLRARLREYKSRPLVLTAMKTLLIIATALSLFLPIVSAHAAIASSPEQASPLKPGAKAPATIVKSADGRGFDLGAAFAEKPTVLIFYRGGWCPYCNQHLAELATLEPKLVAMGYQLLAISPDAPEKLFATAKKHNAAYRLLSDRDMKASSDYGVAFQVDDATAARYAEWKIDLPPIPGNTAARWLPVPSVFIIGRDGIIKFVHSNADYKIRLSADELLSAAK